MLRMKRATAIGFAQALSGAATVDEVDSVIRTGLAPLVDASGAILGTVDHDAHVLRLKLTGVLDPEIARRYEILALDEAGPFSEVLEKRSTRVIKGYDDWRAHAPDERSEARRVRKACVSTCRHRWSLYH